MRITIPATFDGKVFVPDVPVTEVPAGTSLQLTVQPRDHVPALPPLSAGTRAVWLAELDKELPPDPPGEGLADLAERIGVDSPDLPADLAAQHDHYLSGTPKR